MPDIFEFEQRTIDENGRVWAHSAVQVSAPVRLAFGVQWHPPFPDLFPQMRSRWTRLLSSASMAIAAIGFVVMAVYMPTPGQRQEEVTTPDGDERVVWSADTGFIVEPPTMTSPSSSVVMEGIRQS